MGPSSQSYNERNSNAQNGKQSSSTSTGYGQILCAPIIEIADKSEAQAAVLRDISTSIDPGDSPSPQRDTFRETLARKGLLLSNLLLLLCAEAHKAVDMISGASERLKEGNMSIPSNLTHTLQALSRGSEVDASGEQRVTSQRLRCSSSTETKVMALTRTLNEISAFVQHAFSTLMTISFNICLHLIEADRTAWKSHLLSVSNKLREVQQCIAVIMQLIRSGISKRNDKAAGPRTAGSSRSNPRNTLLVHRYSSLSFKQKDNEEFLREPSSPVISCNYRFTL